MTVNYDEMLIKLQKLRNVWTNRRVRTIDIVFKGQTLSYDREHLDGWISMLKRSKGQRLNIKNTMIVSNSLWEKLK